MDTTKDTLRMFGLTEREADVYLLLLGIGQTPASVVSRRLGLPKSTAKYTCDELVAKGVARMLEQSGIAVYMPEEPEKLLLLVDRRKAELDRGRERLQSVMGELKSLMNPNAVLPKIEFFEGKERVIQGFEAIADALRPGEEIVSFFQPLGGKDDIFNLEERLSAVTRAFRKKQIVDKILSPRSPYAERLAEETASYRQTRLFDGHTVENPTEILIFRDSIYAVAAEKGQIFGFLAQNKSIADLLRAGFLALWDQLGAQERRA